MTGTYFAGRLRRRYGLTVLVAEGELPESASARWPEGNPGQILDLTASVDVELPEDFAEVVTVATATRGLRVHVIGPVRP
jgi:hypothetical protein